MKEQTGTHFGTSEKTGGKTGHIGVLVTRKDPLRRKEKCEVKDEVRGGRRGGRDILAEEFGVQ